MKSLNDIIGLDTVDGECAKELFLAGKKFAQEQVSSGELSMDGWLVKNMAADWVEGYVSVYSALRGLVNGGAA